MRMPRLIAITLAVGLFACTRHPGSASGPQRNSPGVQAAGGGAENASPQGIGAAGPGTVNAPPNVRTAPASSGAAHAAANADDHSIGGASVLGNLVVFPVTSRSQVDVGPLISLDEATSAHELELKIRDALEETGLSAIERSTLGSIEEILRTARRMRGVSVHLRSIIVLRSPKRRFTNV